MRLETGLAPVAGIRLALAMLLATALAACVHIKQDPPPPADPQGNYITREMLNQVQPGMTRLQVRAALGSPLLTPVFQTDRWDYVFRYQRPNREFEQRRVVIRFKEDRVAAVEVDGDLPEREDPNDPAMPGARAARKGAKAPTPAAPGQPPQAPAGTAGGNR